MNDNFYHGMPFSIYRIRITKEQAEEIALHRVPGKVQHLKIELENAVLVYKIRIVTKENKIFEVMVGTKTGSILEVEEVKP